MRIVQRSRNLILNGGLHRMSEINSHLSPQFSSHSLTHSLTICPPSSIWLPKPPSWTSIPIPIPIPILTPQTPTHSSQQSPLLPHFLSSTHASPIQRIDQPPLIPQLLQLAQRLTQRHQRALFLRGRIIAVADIEGAGCLLFGSYHCVDEKGGGFVSRCSLRWEEARW